VGSLSNCSSTVLSFRPPTYLHMWKRRHQDKWQKNDFSHLGCFEGNFLPTGIMDLARLVSVLVASNLQGDYFDIAVLGTFSLPRKPSTQANHGVKP
jgi:hypothetical protein